MKKLIKRIALFILIAIAAVIIFILGKYIVSGCGTPGLEFKSNGDGTCYVSGIGRAQTHNVRIPTLSPRGERVTGIGKSAFENYDRLESVKLHDGIKTVGVDAFYGCDGLIYEKYDNAYYIGSKDNPYSILVRAQSTTIDSCVIHPDTEIIYGSAFSGCEYLERIRIPSGVRSIGAYAFAWCPRLSEVRISEGVEIIGEYAFADCPSIGDLGIPSSVTTVEKWAFAFCDGLKSLGFESGGALLSIGDYAFYDCAALASLELSGLSSLDSIGYAAFAGCSSLESVNAPAREVKLGDVAFLGCGKDGLEACFVTKNKVESQLVSDLPENIGVLNTILKAKQLKNLNFYTQNTIYQQTGDIAANKMHTGLFYSSSRIENLFVPNFVSLYSFITSTKDPYSYLYSVDIGDRGNINGDTYYGAVCSTYCSYALGIEGLYTTYQWTSIPNMCELEGYSVNALRLGDTVVGKGHVLIITAIERDTDGKVQTVTLMDIANGGIKERKLTASELSSEYDMQSYTYCRYGAICDSDFEPTPFATIHDKVPKTFNVNSEIIPRKGDKSNWLAGQDVEIDVLNTRGYQRIEIYKDGELMRTIGISQLVILSDLEAGSYKARLVGPDESSAFCYWIVVDAVSVATPSESAGCVDVEFSASNARPIFIVWQDGKANGAKNIQFLTDEEARAGFARGKYVSGSYKVRVAFQTEYGVIFSTLPEEIKIK